MEVLVVANREQMQTLTLDQTPMDNTTKFRLW